MRTLITGAALAVAAIAPLPALAQTPPAGVSEEAKAQPALQPTVETALMNNKGEKIGTVLIKGGPHGTLARVTVQAGGLPPGWHGMHFHAVGDCSDTEKFELSKAHVNHTGAKHGLLNPDGPDEGDLPNLFVNQDGSANAEASTRTLIGGKDGLRDIDGSAMLIHANADDQTSQPIGGAGARIACAVIK
jgi:Cu-Zn family superoxide dismutase